MNKTQRFMNLEGLRGVAAIVVVLYHFIIMFYPVIAYGHSPTLAPIQNMRFEDNLYGNPINVFLSGGFAVGVFFILSGFVLSIGFFQAGKESIIKKLASKRYIRLMLPALASLLIAFILLFFNLDFFRSAVTSITHSGTPGIRNFSPDFFEVIKQGTYSIFFSGQTFYSSYNPVLWTMTYEFAGSFMVFLFLFIFGKAKYRWLVYILLVALTFGSWYIGFVFGMVLADLYTQRKAPFRIQDRKFVLGALFVGLFLGGYPFGETAGTVYSHLRMPWLVGDGNNALYISCGAALVVMAVIALPRLSRFFASSRVSILGKYTYSLYLIHFPLLVTLGMASFAFFSSKVGFNMAVLLTVVSVLPVIAVTTWAFERYVDRSSIRLSNYISDIIHGNVNIDIKQRLQPRVEAWKVALQNELLWRPDFDGE